MARPTTINIESIAREAKVSTATVSRVINHRSEVSDRLRDKVQGVLSKRGYRPQISSNRPTSLGIVVQQDHPVIESFTSVVLSGIAAYSFDQGVETSILFLRHNQARPQRLATTLRERRCDAAVLLFPPPDVVECLEELSKSNMPVMLVSQRCDLPGIGYLDVDSRQGAMMATQHLIGLGHEAIGFLAGPLEDNFDHQQRLAGFRGAMDAAGLGVRENCIIAHNPTESTQEAGYRQAKRLFGADPSVTAMFVNNDEMAQGAIVACVEMGRRVPEDISIVGFDDYPASAYTNPPLTTIRQPLKQMGYDAAKFADTLARGIIHEPPRRTLYGELVVRRSTTAP